MANHNLGTIRGTIEIDYDGAGIVRAVRDTDKAKGAMGKLDGASTKVLSAFGKFAKGAAATAGAVSLLNNAVALVAGTIATVAPLAAAAFAAAPGLVLSFAAALSVAKIALAGMSDALGAAFQDQEKFDKAIENLSPQAKKFATAFRAAVPAINKMRNAIQDAFFQGADRQIDGILKKLATLVPVAASVSTRFRNIAENVIKTATNGPNLVGLQTILGGVDAFLARIQRSLGPVVSGFIGLAAQASKFGSAIGGNVAKALASFSIWLNNIDLDAVFATALPIIKSLGSFLGDVATIAKEIFSIFITDGSGAAGILANLAAQLAAFLQSADGQAALQALGQAMQAIGGAAGQVFLTLLQALAPAIVALAPGITILAQQIAGLLVPAINAAAPLLKNFATFLSENMGWLGPVTGAIVALAAAYKVYAAAAKAVAAVQAILKSKIVTTTAAWVANTASIVANRIAQLASATATGVTAVAAWAANTAAVIANRIATMAAAVAQGIVKAATIAWTAVQWLLNIALDANPIGLIVLAIAALVAGIIYAYKNSETFRRIVAAAWEDIKARTMLLWNVVKAVFAAGVAFIKAYYTLLWNITKAVWSGIVSTVKGYINAYRTVIVAVINFVKGAWSNFLNGLRIITQAVWNAISNFIRARINQIKTVITGVKVVVGIVRNAFNQANAAVKNAISSILSTVRSIPGRIRSALGGMASLLYSKGRELIRGFVNGIGSMIGAVRDKVNSVVSSVTRFLPGSPAKEGPLSGRGYVLLRARRFMNDFAQGIQDGSQKPSAALAGAAGGLGRATVPTTLTTKSGSSTAPTTPTGGGGTREYNIAIGDRTFAKLVIDAMTGDPVAVKKAVDRGTQQTAWAGR